MIFHPEVLRRFELGMIPYEEWGTAPEAARALAVGESNKKVPTGITHDDEFGWVVIQSSGQGPYVIWTEDSVNLKGDLSAGFPVAVQVRSRTADSVFGDWGTTRASYHEDERRLYLYERRSYGHPEIQSFSASYLNVEKVAFDGEELLFTCPGGLEMRVRRAPTR